MDIYYSKKKKSRTQILYLNPIFGYSQLLM